MKKFLLIILFLGLVPVYAQDFGNGPQGGPPMEKIEELERIKLLETLNLDEETSIRFFTRRGQYKADMQKVIDQKEKLVDELEDALKNNKKINYKAKTDKISELEKQIYQTRDKFLNSLDVLTQEQIAKVVVFENRFFREIRNTLIRRGRGGRD